MVGPPEIAAHGNRTETVDLDQQPGRTENVATPAERDGDVGRNLYGHAERCRHDRLQSTHGVLFREQRFGVMVPTRADSIRMRRLLLLQPTGVGQDDRGQRLRPGRHVHRRPEPGADECRQVAEMIDVRMRDHDGVERPHIEGQLGTVSLSQFLVALEEPTVDQNRRRRGTEEELASGDRSDAAEEPDRRTSAGPNRARVDRGNRLRDDRDHGLDTGTCDGAVPRSKAGATGDQSPDISRMLAPRLGRG